jgi:hypothetical protein
MDDSEHVESAGPQIQPDPPSIKPKAKRTNGVHPPQDDATAKPNPASDDPFVDGEEAETADAERPAGSIFDDLESLQEEGEDTEGGAEEILTYVRVGKPAKGEYFRVHPEWHLTAWIWVTAPRQGQLSGETYFVTKMARHLFKDDDTALKRVDFVPWITLDGEIGLWPVAKPLPGAPNGGTGWAISAQSVAHRAKTDWVRLLSGKGAYRAFPAQDEHPEPKWLHEFREILRVGLQDRVVDSAEHEAYRVEWLGKKPRA